MILTLANLLGRLYERCQSIISKFMEEDDVGNNELYAACVTLFIYRTSRGCGDDVEMHDTYNEPYNEPYNETGNVGEIVKKNQHIVGFDRDPSIAFKMAKSVYDKYKNQEFNVSQDDEIIIDYGVDDNLTVWKSGVKSRVGGYHVSVVPLGVVIDKPPFDNQGFSDWIVDWIKLT